MDLKGGEYASRKNALFPSDVNASKDSGPYASPEFSVLLHTCRRTGGAPGGRYLALDGCANLPFL